MEYIKAVYFDLEKCCEDFVKGIELLEQGSVKDSVGSFKRACESVAENHCFFSRYYSYYGFSLLLCGDLSAIELCRKAAKSSPFDGDIYMNLARAERFVNNRQEALRAIEQGLRFSSAHEGLKKLKINLGVRKHRPLPFLSRNNPLNVVLGRRMRRYR